VLAARRFVFFDANFEDRTPHCFAGFAMNAARLVQLRNLCPPRLLPIYRSARGN
jgi:hypothetical protein